MISEASPVNCGFLLENCRRSTGIPAGCDTLDHFGPLAAFTQARCSTSATWVALRPAQSAI
jgi:hypothetical protein